VVEAAVVEADAMTEPTRGAPEVAEVVPAVCVLRRPEAAASAGEALSPFT
jgi:hypothetical protein